jgi:hypothetical protein
MLRLNIPSSYPPRWSVEVGMADEMREFVVSYEFDGGQWMTGIMAKSAEDAARRVRALRRTAVLLGSTELFTPVEVEYEGERRSLNPSD